jgi:hypothetical protein
MPPSYPVFDHKDFGPEEPLFEISPPEFPIWGVSVAGFGIGIFAFVEACLRFDAFVGPGTLQNAKLGVTFDLEKPEDAVVDGGAEFVVPGGAGFTLDIGGGLRARVAIASLEGRVGLDARLGVEGEARAGVCVHWSRADGLLLDALLKVNARPRFDIGVNASVTGEISLPWPLPDLSKTWGPWRKSLGSFGPDLEVGVQMPVAWSEASGLDFDVGDIAITKKPEIDPAGLMLDGFETLV